MRLGRLNYAQDGWTARARTKLSRASYDFPSGISSDSRLVPYAPSDAWNQVSI